MKPKLEITSIWEDDDLFEVKVYASNGRFAGTANCYTLRSEMKVLGEVFEDFPKSLKNEISFSSSDSDSMSYFSLHMNCVDGSGHINVRVKIVHIIKYSDGSSENDMVEFDLAVEPASIDRFSSSIKTLSQSELGSVKAILLGKA